MTVTPTTAFGGFNYMPRQHPQRVLEPPPMTHDAFLNYCEQYRPSNIVTMDDPDFAKRAHERLSGFGTKIFYRYATQDAALYKAYPDADKFLDKIYGDFDGYPITLILACEGEVSEPAYVQWRCRVADRNLARRRVPLAFLGLFTGAPHDRDYGRYHGELERVALNPDLYCIHVHEYWPGWVLAELWRGDNWHYFPHERADGLPQLPLLDDARTGRRPLSYVGRIADLLLHLERFLPGADIPIWISEFGFDGVNDPNLNAWLDSLVIDNAMKARGARLGWNVLKPQWALWRPDLSTEQVLLAAYRYARDTIYQHIRGVRGLSWFTINDSGKLPATNWEGQRLDSSPVLMQMLLEEAQRERGVSQPPMPQPDPLPVPPSVPPAPIPSGMTREQAYALSAAYEAAGKGQLELAVTWLHIAENMD